MADDGVNALIIAGCSHRTKTDEFQFETSLFDRVDLRDKCLWIQDSSESADEETEEDLQMMMEDYIRIGCVKVKKMDSPEPFHNDGGFSKDILAVGGGIAGLTTAKEISDTGYNSILVKKCDALGGKLAKMHTPLSCLSVKR
jgi:quinone-modifying oxidoreductase, subunit QmoB